MNDQPPPNASAQLRAIEGTLGQTWKIPETVLDALPKLAAQIAVEKDKDGKEYVYDTKDRIAAMRILLTMQSQNQPAVKRVEHEHTHTHSLEQHRARVVARLGDPSQDDRGTGGDREAA